MEGLAERPAQTGEYDAGMRALLQQVWGDGFLSPGGPDEIARLLEGVDLRGRRVLGIGCALGAIDILLVTHHGAAQVTGIDLDAEPIAKVQARIAAAGFIDIELQDRSAWYVDLTRREHAALSGKWRETLIARIGEARTLHLIANWRQLVTVLERGELRPTHLLARRAR